MKTCNLIISSKKLSTLNTFTTLFSCFCILNFSYYNKKIIRKKKQKVFTLLKSPHVNKKAQEQFGIQYFSKKINLNINTIFRFLIFLKKLKMYSFAKINIKIETFISTTKTKSLLKIFNIKNYKNLKYRKKKDNKMYLRKLKKKLILKEKNQNLIKIFDFYGNIKKYEKYVWIAQLVEQRTENPCDGSSNLPLNINQKRQKK
jgi:ribosomal protein S10